MTKKIKQAITFLASPWRIIISIGIVVSLFVGLQTVDSRFAKTKQLDSLQTTVLKERTSALQLAEAQTVQTFQIFQQKQQTQNQALQLQILNIQKENLDKQYYDLKRKQQQTPDDIFIREELNEVKQQRAEIKRRINSVLN